MLATRTTDLIVDERYLYEVKWDGYRIIAYVENGKVRLESRGGLNYTDRYPLVVDALKQLRHNCVLDGEMVVFDENGKPKFNAVQLYNGQRSPITYYVFDLLWLDGKDLKNLELVERKAMLQKLLKKGNTLQYSESFDDGEGLYKLMQQKGWEGIVAKRKDSEYWENNRSDKWLKIQIKRIDEFVIGGWAESDKARAFRSLLFGAYQNGEFRWVGRSGGGFKDEEMPGILSQLRKLEIKKSPFVNKVLDTKGAPLHWVKPKLVANFEYSDMTESGRIRKPATWKGFRYDKDPKQVLIPETKSFANVKAIPAPPAAKTVSPTTTRNRPPRYLNEGSGWQKVDEEQKDAEWIDFDMENCSIAVHHLEKELWKGVPKGRLLIYYSEMADIILPYIKDRPQSLNLKLVNAGASTTFVKDMENRQPACAMVFTTAREIPGKGKRSQIDYLVVNNKESLIYMIDLGCIDINPWSSRYQTPKQPDYIWLDLDPTIPKALAKEEKLKAEEKGFRKAVETARAAKEVLSKHKLTSFIKTSGKTGIHVYIPCSQFDNDKVTALAYHLANEIHAMAPNITTVKRSVSLRGDKVYIDPEQNYNTKTLAAPYSIRPYHEPLVSTPLDWKELTSGLDRYAFTIDSISKRIRSKGELWKQLHDKRSIARNNRILNKL